MTQRGNDPNKGPAAFDLEDRTEDFAREVRAFVKSLPRTLSNLQDVPQLVRSSGSVAANYIEANEALGHKDFRMRIRICRKEAKESRLFLRLLEAGMSADVQSARQRLEQEADELTKIFGAIIRKTE